MKTSTVQGFEDETQLYQAMKLRTEHGQFAMNVGATSIFDQAYLDDDYSQGSNDDEENSMGDPEDDYAPNELEHDKNEALLVNLMASTAQAGKPRGLILNTFPRFGGLAMKMPRKQLMLPPKLLFKKMIQFYQETMPQMTGC